MRMKMGLNIAAVARRWRVFWFLTLLSLSAWSRPSLALLQPSAYPDAGATGVESLYRWRRQLVRLGQEVMVVHPHQVGSLPATAVLVVPSVRLQPEEAQAVDDFARRGGNLLMTGESVLSSVEPALKAWGFVGPTFGMSVLGRMRAEAELFLMPMGEGPLTQQLPAGRRLSMGTDTSRVLRFQAQSTAAVMMNWVRARDDDTLPAAIAFKEAGGLRAVYFGFSEAQWGYMPKTDLRQLIAGVIAWLEREPVATLAVWPGAYQAAHLIEMDTEAEFPSAEQFAADMQAQGFKATFYCLTSEAIKYPDLVRQLRQQGHEIAYHAEIHVGFNGLSEAQQKARMDTMVSQMRSILGDDAAQVAGFRAPTEGYDKFTEQVMRHHGIRHHAADPSASQDRVPFFSSAEPGLGPLDALVVLPRTQLDDVNFKRMLYGPAQVGVTLARDLDLIVQSGALGLLSVHTQNYVPGGLMRNLMPAYLALVAARRNQLWVATGGEIESWWRKRAQVHLSAARTGDGVVLDLHLDSDVALEQVGVWLSLPKAGAVPSLSLPATLQGQVKVMNMDVYRSKLIFQSLPPGATRVVVRFEG